MNSVTSTALSGLQAAQSRLQVAAHDIASTATQDPQVQAAAAFTAPTSGATRPEVILAVAPGTSIESSLVGLLQAKQSFMANLSVFGVGDSMLGSLLDAKT